MTDTIAHAPLIIDIAGTELDAADRARLLHPLVGGIILFGRNWAGREALQALCASIRALRSDLLICVDHEGGRVQRFRTDGFTHLPPMRALGQMWEGGCAEGSASDAAQDGPARSAAQQAMNAATAAGFVLGAELRACGVDLSFTPVLDLDWGRSAVIGDRSFGRDPAMVATLARCLMHGLLRAGMMNCGKHFPGHGFVVADSHVDVPVDERSLPAILADDAAPYPWLSAAMTAVMPAHVIYPAVDSLPAGFSPRWLRDILRAQMGFEGLIFSDDLAMEGARQLQGRSVTHTEAALAALHAGCDMVLLCNQSCENGGQAIDALLHGLHTAQQQGQWQPSASSEARRRALLPTAPAPGWDALMRSGSYRHARALLP